MIRLSRSKSSTARLPGPLVPAVSAETFHTVTARSALKSASLFLSLPSRSARKLALRQLRAQPLPQIFPSSGTPFCRARQHAPSVKRSTAPLRSTTVSSRLARAAASRASAKILSPSPRSAQSSAPTSTPAPLRPDLRSRGPDLTRIAFDKPRLFREIAFRQLPS